LGRIADVLEIPIEDFFKTEQKIWAQLIFFYLLGKCLVFCQNHWNKSYVCYNGHGWEIINEIHYNIYLKKRRNLHEKWNNFIWKSRY
jgi:hypothetical protein